MAFWARILKIGITSQDRAARDKGTIEDWMTEGDRLTRTVADRDLGTRSPAAKKLLSRCRVWWFGLSLQTGRPA